MLSLAIGASVNMGMGAREIGEIINTSFISRTEVNIHSRAESCADADVGSETGSALR